MARHVRVGLVVLTMLGMVVLPVRAEEPPCEDRAMALALRVQHLERQRAQQEAEVSQMLARALRENAALRAENAALKAAGKK